MLIAYLLSINSYIFARHIIQIFTNHLFYGPSPGIGWVYFVNDLVYFTTFLCGCLMAGLIEKRWLAVLHGAAATAAGTALYVSFYYQPLKDYILSTLSGGAVGAILGGTGSLITIAIKSVINKRR